MMVSDGCTDNDLLDRIRSGDGAAFDTLFGRYSIHASVLAQRAAQPSDADDVLQEVWLQVFQRPPTTVSNFGSWLGVVIRRTAARRSARDARVEQLDEPLASDMTSPTRQVARQEAVELLHDAHEKGRITEKEFEALVDSVVDVFETAEVASSGGVTVSAWRDRVRRAKQKLGAIASAARHRV
jgi:RNA polymerase sigma factor (sigma-70 family)